MIVNKLSPLFMTEEERRSKRLDLDLLVEKLQKHKMVRLKPDINNVGSFDYVIQFLFGEARVTVYFCFCDHQVLSDVVITNMTTLPYEECSKGWGSKVVSYFLEWGRENGFKEIRATQVGNPRSEKFWEKNGFTVVPEPNDCGDWVYVFAG